MTDRPGYSRAEPKERAEKILSVLKIPHNHGKIDKRLLLINELSKLLEQLSFENYGNNYVLHDHEAVLSVLIKTPKKLIRPESLYPRGA